MRYAVVLFLLALLAVGSFPATADEVVAPRITEDSTVVITALPFLNKGEDEMVPLSCAHSTALIDFSMTKIECAEVCGGCFVCRQAPGGGPCADCQCC